MTFLMWQVTTCARPVPAARTPDAAKRPPVSCVPAWTDSSATRWTAAVASARGTPSAATTRPASTSAAAILARRAVSTPTAAFW